MHVQYTFVLSVVLALCCVEGFLVTNFTLHMANGTELRLVLTDGECQRCLCQMDRISELNHDIGAERGGNDICPICDCR
ncbi:unnamed protein product [Trichobilharzia szidati]|nr:unnamed protein product [Trichobilharzia szidati]